MNLAVFTVCSNYQVPQARVFFETVARFLPSARQFLVLADERHPNVQYPAGCQVVPAQSLDIPDFSEFAFRYNQKEFAAALKPFAIRFLIDTRSCTHCLYFDPWTELFSAIPAVIQALADNASFVLTPHLLEPSESEDGPNDVTFMRVGAFNLGFLGVSCTPEAERLLEWWSRWLRRSCVDEPAVGLFVDQRFIDLVPGFTSDARILYDAGLNVAAWNVLQRGFEPDALGGPTVKGQPLGFFNYSGFDPARPSQLHDGKAQWIEDGVPVAWRDFLSAYARRLEAVGHGTIPRGSYAYGRFSSGVPIPDIVRRMFRNDHPAWAGDPFETYEAWCHLPAHDAVVGIGSAVPSLMLVWLQARQPTLTNLSIRDQEGAESIIRWWLDRGASLGVDRRFIQPLATAAGRRPLVGRSVRPAVTAERPDVAVVAPLLNQEPAGLIGRSVLNSLATAGTRTEGLDVLGAGTREATGRLLAVCLAPGRLRPFLHVSAPRLPSRAFRVFVPSAEVFELSDAFLTALQTFDEVWAPTRFIQQELVLATELPVLHLPVFEISVGTRPTLHRPGVTDGSNLPVSNFVLALDDAFPGSDGLMTAVQAFDAAFRRTPIPHRPRLVMAGDRSEQWSSQLQEAATAVEAIVMPAAAVNVAEAACVLALHRGEALGLAVAHAMAAGVPVVATDYGGGTDVLTPSTGFPVEACRAPPGSNVAHAGIVRADPQHAAWSLRELFDLPDQARRRAAAGREAITATYNSKLVASRVARRLVDLGLLEPEPKKAIWSQVSYDAR